MLPQDFFMLELFMIVQSKKLFFIKVFCWCIFLLNFYQGRCFCDLQFPVSMRTKSLPSLELPSSTVIIHIASNLKGLWTQAISSPELKIIGTWSKVVSKDAYWCLLKSKNTSHHGQPPDPSNCSITFAKACHLFDHLNGLPENPRSIRVIIRPLEPPKELPKRRPPFFSLFFSWITMKSIKISQTLTDSQVTFLPKQAEICKRYRYSSLKFYILSPESNRYLISQPRWFFTYISKYSSQFL